MVVQPDKVSRMPQRSQRPRRSSKHKHDKNDQNDKKKKIKKKANPKIKQVIKMFGIGLASAISFNLFILLLLNSNTVKRKITQYAKKIYTRVTRTDPLYKGLNLIVSYTNKFAETSRLAFQYLNPQVLMHTFQQAISNNYTEENLNNQLTKALRNAGVYVSNTISSTYNGAQSVYNRVITNAPMVPMHMPGEWPEEQLPALTYHNVSNREITELTNNTQEPLTFFNRLYNLRFF